jgi:hypothetical protein
MCSNCDLEWPYDLALDVPCPTCRAKPGSRCVRPSGHPAMNLHIPRDQAALDAGALVRCPEPHDAHHHLILTDSARQDAGFPVVAPNNVPASMRPKANRERKQKRREPAPPAPAPEVSAPVAPLAARRTLDAWL